MKIAIVSDAWHPQVNGVVRTLESVGRELAKMGHGVTMVTPDQFRSVPCPSYPEVRLSLAGPEAVGARLASAAPDCIHIATEGPLGWAARRWCLRQGICYTTAFHTMFPDYMKARTGLPTSVTWAWLRGFHRHSRAVLVPTEGLRSQLEARGFARAKVWSRGVDVELFRPRSKDALRFPRPIFLYVGRVAVEKNLEAFLSAPLPGTKVVAGGGPALARLRGEYLDARFVGPKHGEELAEVYAAADVFVFPSRTDTFGLVMLEALAAGVPVAAYPERGPTDVLGDSGAGVLAADLTSAALAALKVSPDKCRRRALEFSWRACAERFAECLVPAGSGVPVSETRAIQAAEAR